jgi:para-nitrobenzyl esterase
MNRRDFLQSSTLIAAGLLSRPLHAQSAPIASIRSGRIRGFSDQGILVFKGIPYGADTSSTRLARPQ